MESLFEQIRLAVHEDRFIVSNHADDRLRERKMKLWQIVEGTDSARFISENTTASPNPTVVLEQLLPDGTAVHVVWAWIARRQIAKLVTVYFPV
jgi:hypothetical protein